MNDLEELTEIVTQFNAETRLLVGATEDMKTAYRSGDTISFDRATRRYDRARRVLIGLSEKLIKRNDIPPGYKLFLKVLNNLSVELTGKFIRRN